jgi:quercetin dioxygenase-like cupin family protein
MDNYVPAVTIESGRAPEPHVTQPELGERLRGLRQSRNLSLTDVAAATGISTSFLSLVETGRSDITIGRLLRLVEFFGTKINELLPSKVSVDELIVRKGAHRHIHSSSEGLDIYLLAPDTNRPIMPLLAVLDPRSEGAEYASHEGDEFVYVVKGVVTLVLDGAEPLRLSEGDTIYFPANRPHLYKNEGNVEARFFAVLTPPVL